MKKIFVLYIVSMLISCYITPEISYSWVIPENINTLVDAQNFLYKIDYVESRNIQLPDETYNLFHGDCADLSLLFAHILEEKLNKDAYVCVGIYDNIDLHAWVYSDGIFYECTAGGQIISDMSKYHQINKYSYTTLLDVILKGNL